MKKTIVLKSPEQYRAVAEALDSLPADTIHVVRISPHRSNISAQQRAYYWLCLGVISGHTGDVKEDLHLTFKKRFLVDIFAANEADHPGYGEMMESLREVYKRGMTGHAKRFYDFVVAETSIMDSSVVEMTEYIEAIIRVAGQELHVIFPALEQDIMRYAK